VSCRDNGKRGRVFATSSKAVSRYLLATQPVPATAVAVRLLTECLIMPQALRPATDTVRDARPSTIENAHVAAMMRFRDIEIRSSHYHQLERQASRRRAKQIDSGGSAQPNERHACIPGSPICHPHYLCRRHEAHRALSFLFFPFLYLSLSSPVMISFAAVDLSTGTRHR
jgi:hypothetical protein